MVCQGEANASRGVRWRCVTEEAPRVKEVEMPASESRYVAEHHIGLRACGGAAEGDEQGGAAGAAALISVPHLRDEQRRACDVAKRSCERPQHRDRESAEASRFRRVFNKWFRENQTQDCLAKKRKVVDRVQLRCGGGFKCREAWP